MSIPTPGTSQAGREHDEQEHADDEVGHRVEDQAQSVPDEVDRATAFPAGVRTQGEPTERRDDLADPEQDHRRPEVRRKDVDDGLPLELDRVPQVTLDGRLDEGDELVGDQRLVDPPLLTLGRDDPASRFGFRRSARSGEPGIIRNRMKLNRTIKAIVMTA